MIAESAAPFLETGGGNDTLADSACRTPITHPSLKMAATDSIHVDDYKVGDWERRYVKIRTIQYNSSSTRR